jgi:ATP-dependent RNA helicase RhlE
VVAVRILETAPLQNFSSLDLASPIFKAIQREGYEIPTPIQAQAIPPIMAGEDVLGCAQTGTGKTAAFALPLLHRLHTSRPDKKRRGPVLPRALILSPTRELATQIADSFGTYGQNTGLRYTTIFGGVSQSKQVRHLKAGVDILVATPGRLLDLMDQGYVNLNAIEMFVLDEADRMLDMGFIQPIRQIAGEIPKERQTLLFSATMPNNISQLANSLLTNPVKISVTPVASAAPLIEQSLYMIPASAKPRMLLRLLQDRSVERALVFTRTKHGADKLTKVLNNGNVSTAAIHGNKSQNNRQRALDAFKYGRARVLVATDVAARGIDVDGVTHVFNFNIPNEPESYVHRIGRTGRAGATGHAIAFCDRDERGHLKAIERLTDSPLKELQVPADICDERIERFAPGKPKPTQRRRPSGNKPARGGYGRDGRPNNRGETAQTSAPSKKKKPYSKKSAAKNPASNSHAPSKPTSKKTARPAGKKEAAPGGAQPKSRRPRHKKKAARPAASNRSS